jgi:hypothetical protein
VRCEHEHAVGAYVLDALEPAEQLRMAQHVQECPVCSATVRELEGLPRLLASVPMPDEPLRGPPPSELAYERFRRSATAAPRAPRRKRWWVAAVAAVLIVAGGITGVVVASRPDPTVVAARDDDGLWASATYVEANEGTRYELDIGGFPAGEKCVLAVVDDDGRVVPVGDWDVRDAGTNSWSGWFDLDPGQVEAFLVRDADGHTLLTLERS